MPQVPNRERYESIFSDSIQQDLTKQEKAIRKMFKSGTKPDKAFWKQVDQETTDSTSILLRPLHERGQKNTASVKRKLSDIRDKANIWSQERAEQLSKELRETTTSGLKDLAEKLKDKSLTIKKRREILNQGMTDLFGQARAERIATTEVTNAFTSGEMSGAEGRGLLAIWNVGSNPCKICKKLEGTPRRVWGRKFPNGPPAHPSCNCFLTWSVRTSKA